MISKNRGFSHVSLAVVLSLTLIATLVLTACQPEPEVVTEQVVATEIVEAEKIVDPTACNLEAPDSPVTINLIGWPFAATEFYADEVEKCEEVENIEINIQQLDFTAVIEAINLALSTGDPSPYDIVHATNPEIASWGPQGWLLPLNDLIEKYSDEYDLGDIPQGAWDGATVDGQVMGVPIIGDSQIIAYRSDLFEQHDLAVPTTYDEIIAAFGPAAVRRAS